jgi:hypothetical protein
LTGNAVFISAQRVFALKRTAVLRIEMLKQVHDAERGVSITTYGVSRTEPAQQFGFSMHLMKLSGQRVWEVPHIVIPNLFRDLVLISLSAEIGKLSSAYPFVSLSFEANQYS